MIESDNGIVAAKNALQELALLGVDTQKKQQLLEKRTRQLVDAGIKMGKRLYSKGDIEQALKKWTEIQVFAPNDLQLKEYIAKAEKFIDNINRFNELKKSN